MAAPQEMRRMAEPSSRAALKATGVQFPTMLLGTFRLLAVALLALTLPVQGMAAVTAAQCMAVGHHQDGGSPDHDHAEHGADDQDPASHSHPGDSSAQAGDESGTNSHCGPCTACCASASIAGPARLSILSSPSTAKYVFSQQPPPGVQLAGVDRPPLAL